MKKEIISKNFGNNCHSYDAYADVQKNAAKTLAALLPEQSAPKILELGCGTGFLTKEIFKKYPDASFDITDLSQKMVDYCQSKTSTKNINATYFQMDAEKIDIKNEYDFIVSGMTFQWMCNPIEEIKKLSNIAPVYYSTIGQDNFREWDLHLKELNLDNRIIKTPKWPNVMKEEFVTKEYGSGFNFLTMLKKTGASTPSQANNALSPSHIKSAADKFNGKITWHIVYASTAT